MINKKIENLIILFFLLVFFTEFLKLFIFSETYADFFKSLRIGLPLFSSLLLLIQGLNANKEIVWKVLLWAISVSAILSIISLFITLPIFYNLEDNENILSETGGRLVNSNSSFGIIGLYLLFDNKQKWYNKGRLSLYTSILSIIALILTFNRTYLVLLFAGFIYLSFKSFNLKNSFKIIFLPIIGFITVYGVYDNFPVVQHQIDKRIFSIIYQKTTIKESTIENNRDVIYEGIISRIYEGYWVVGLPLNIPIFTKAINYKTDVIKMSVTDTSFANVLLRYGVLALLILIVIYYRLFKLSRSHLYKFCFTLFLIASLNIDSLFRQNSVFFLIIIFLISNNQFSEKNSFYSKNKFK